MSIVGAEINTVMGLWADISFGWRQLMKRKVATGARRVVARLGDRSVVARPFGSWTRYFCARCRCLIREAFTPFRIADFDSQTGAPDTWDSNSYPMFRRFREALQGPAQVVAVSFVNRVDLTLRFSRRNGRKPIFRKFLEKCSQSSVCARPSGDLSPKFDDLMPGTKPMAVPVLWLLDRSFRTEPGHRWAHTSYG